MMFFLLNLACYNEVLRFQRVEITGTIESELSVGEGDGAVVDSRVEGEGAGVDGVIPDCHCVFWAVECAGPV